MSQIILQSITFSTIIPNTGEFILAVDSDGILKLKTSTELIPLSSSDVLRYTEVNYSEFKNLFDTNSLKSGNVYLITDFQTVYYQQYTDDNGDGTGPNTIVESGPVEPILVLATSDNTYDSEVKSILHPTDYIIWEHELNDFDREYYQLTGKGHIILRRNINGNQRDYDFRSVKFRRWNDGLGNYSIVRKIDAPDQNDSIELFAFHLDLSKNSIVRSGLSANPFGTTFSYFMDNLVVFTQSQFNNNIIGDSHGVTINVDKFESNTISEIGDVLIWNNTSEFTFNSFNTSYNSEFICDIVNNNNINLITNSTFNNALISNKISSISDSIIGTMGASIITTIENSNLGVVSHSNISYLADSNVLYLSNSNFNEFILNDISWCENNSSQSVRNNNIGTMSGNNVNSIEYNNILVLNNNISSTIVANTSSNISNNISNQIEMNIVDDIINNSVDFILSNQILDITNNKGVKIENNTGTCSVVDNIVSEIENNIGSSGSVISTNTSISITGNTFDLIFSNKVSGILNNNCLVIERNIGDQILNNTNDVISSNIIKVINSNVSGNINNNKGIDYLNNTGEIVYNNVMIMSNNDVGTISNNTSYTIDGNNGNEISYNSVSEIYQNLVDSILNNESNQILGNTVSLIQNNKSNQISQNFDSINNGGIIKDNNTLEINLNFDFTEISSNVGNQINNNLFSPTIYSGSFATFGFSGTPSVGDISTISYANFQTIVTATTASQIGFVEEIFNQFPQNGFVATYSIDTFQLTAPTGSVSYNGSFFSIQISGSDSIVDNLTYNPSGSPLNDLSIDVSGYTLPSETQYVLVIVGTSSPNNFFWIDSLGNSASSLSITGSAQLLSNGVEITFANTTGHSVGDVWTWDVISGVSLFSPTFSGIFIGETFFDSSSVIGNIVNTIVGNTFSGIEYNKSNSISYNNGVTKIENNSIGEISNNDTIFKISKSEGSRIESTSGTTLLEIERVRGIDMIGVDILDDVKNHKFLDSLDNIILDPTSNIQSLTQSTVSRYLFDLDGHYEEIANSTGLTWSGPIG